MIKNSIWLNLGLLLLLTFNLHAESSIEQVVVLGSGPAGLSAALYTARAGLSTLILEGELPGGQLIYASLVENYPGFSEGIQGFQLQENMCAQALRFGATLKSATVTSVDFSTRPFHLKLNDGSSAYAQTLIIATGVSPKTLGLASEEFFKGKGVGICAFCDACLYQDKEVVVVGKNKMAIDEAFLLANYASKVTIINDGDSFDADQAAQNRIKEQPKIDVLWNHVVEDILDPLQDKLIGVQLKDLKNGDKKFYPCEGVFVVIGHQPNTALFKDWLDLDEKGYIKTHDEVKTSIPGIFAAGTAADTCYSQIIICAASGCKSGIKAYQFLQHEKNREAK